MFWTLQQEWGQLPAPNRPRLEYEIRVNLMCSILHLDGIGYLHEVFKQRMSYNVIVVIVNILAQYLTFQKSDRYH